MITSGNANSTEYINTTDYNTLKPKLRDLRSVLDDNTKQVTAERKLRYADVDVEGERSSSKLAPDELYIPQHIIDSNIRREQSSYVQYVVQSPRAVIMEDLDTFGADTSLIEKDVTKKLRYDGYQLSMFACIDGMQQTGYGVMEVVLDTSKPGELAHEFVQRGDFAVVSDTKDIQEAELVGRNYYFTKTDLLKMCLPPEQKGRGFNQEQVVKVVESEPTNNASNNPDPKDKSLHIIQKVMFRVNGVVMVAWTNEEKCDDWIREPRPLFIGRRELGVDPMSGQPVVDPMTNVPVSQDKYEVNYPYILFPYLISENNTISQLRGRVFLDQDTQEAASSLLSSFVTAHRRAAGLYFSKEVEDPNDDALMQKNVFFKTGALINSKIKQFQLQAPGSDLLAGLQSLVTANQQQTGQVNFAAMNRQDSRKTATEIQASSQESQALSTVQVVLFSNSLRNLYSVMLDVIKSRILAGLIKVEPQLMQMYARRYAIKPSGDVDVIERQQIVAAMQNAWPVMQGTPAAMAFLSDMLMKMFPEFAPKYLQIFQQAQIAAQQQQQSMQQAIAQGLVELAKHPEYFSPEGQKEALPNVQKAAAAIMQQSGQQPPQAQ